MGKRRFLLLGCVAVVGAAAVLWLMMNSRRGGPPVPAAAPSPVADGQAEPSQASSPVAPPSGSAPEGAPAHVASSPADAPQATVAEGANPAAGQPAVKRPIPPAKAAAPNDALATVIGRGAERSYTARLEAVQRLPPGPAPAQVEALLEFLDSRLSEQGDLELLAFNAIKNDALGYLLRQKDLPAGIGEQLLRMYRDRKHDDIWRGYCVQFFGDYYDRAWPEGGRQDAGDPLRQGYEAAYWDALGETETHVAGTALIGIELVSRKHPELDRARIGRKALDLAADRKTGAHTRLTAIQVCAAMGLAEVLPTARIEAQAGENTTVRLSAISAIGQVGSGEDAELLRGIAASSDPYPAKAAAKALERLRGRMKDAGE